MPLNPAKVGLAVQQHVSVVCATCEHYWSAQDRQSPTCGKDCGGPVSGRAFPQYKGPMGSFSCWCFVCGESSHFVLRHPCRDLGVCHHHESMVSSWCEQHGLSLVQVIATPKAKPSLAQAIYEVEKHYADKEGREL